MRTWLTVAVVLLGVGCDIRQLFAADLVTLTPENWEEFAPRGKEADCIYGDVVLRNDRVVAVIANTVRGRNANMTVKNVGGSLIDFTLRAEPNDQLSVYYTYPVSLVPLEGSKVRIMAEGAAIEARPANVLNRKTVSWECPGMPADGAAKGTISQTVRYTLADGEPFLRVETEFKNETSEPRTLELRDPVRADRTFTSFDGGSPDLFLIFDDWFAQAYGVRAEGYSIIRGEGKGKTQSGSLEFTPAGGKPITLAAGQSHTFRRQLLVGRNTLEVRGQASRLKNPEQMLHPVAIEVRDANGPVAHAHVQFLAGSEGAMVGAGRTSAAGLLSGELPAGAYRVRITAQAREPREQAFELPAHPKVAVELSAAGFVRGTITDGEGAELPCKVEFQNLAVPATVANWNDAHLPPLANAAGKPVHPYFGPDSAAPNCLNLVYTANGQFRQEMAPGKYRVIVSHGPEYDAVFTELEVKAGQETPLAARLVRSVDTRGWVSADFHSHSTPSGDNTSDTLGRVLNLLAEHVEFAPCTEHNRITTYDLYLKRLASHKFMKSCAGMELTGSLLPVNHHNAFPLLEKPRTQDGGGPTVDSDPEVQISRLALWDDQSDKLLQQNHPNLVQILGDRDLDGKPDAGFHKMFGFMDVIEIHNMHGKLRMPEPAPSNKPVDQTSFHWAQLLNLGHRIPGVVNTDAHYNFHGSGWLRNWIKSTTDDPEKLDVLEMVHASEQGHLVMSNGPFLSVGVRAARPGEKASGGPGETVVAPGGECVLTIKVQCPNWFDINRVQVIRNGRLDPALNFTRGANADKFRSEGAVRFEQEVSLVLKEDTHLIVAAAGEGLGLGPVMGPQHKSDEPIALANPVYIDLAGDGFTANGDDLGSKPLVLPQNVPAPGRPAKKGGK